MNYLMIPILNSPDAAASVASQGSPSAPRDKTPAARAKKAKEIYDFRRRREKHVSAELLGEPGWDILLLAYFLGHEGKPISVNGLCAGSGVPYSTALRWQTSLQKRGFLTRTADPDDARRTFVALSEAGQRVMDELIDEYP